MLKRAKEVLFKEAEAVRQLADHLDQSFINAVEKILACQGKLIVTGIGKSGLIGRKLSATFNSTGTPSIFLHPVEGLHGDIGILQKTDLFLAVSKSGNLDELERLYPVIERLGVEIISITGNPKSTLAQKSNITLDASISEEVCNHNLAPTSSSTAALALGDALAIVVQEQRGFSLDDFSLLHPGGTLGRRLTIKVKDLMHNGDKLPIVKINTAVKDMLLEMTRKRLGLTLVVDKEDKLQGIFTDGDLRRLVESGDNFLEKKSSDVMIKGAKQIDADALAEKALQIMEEFKITSLIVLDDSQRPLGLLHIHDILESKIV